MFLGVLIYVFIANDHISSCMIWMFRGAIRIDKLIQETLKVLKLPSVATKRATALQTVKS